MRGFLLGAVLIEPTRDHTTEPQRLLFFARHAREEAHSPNEKPAYHPEAISGL